MIIPIRCFTCGKMIADKWMYFVEATNEDKNVDKKKLLDDMKLYRICCRRHIIGHVDLIDKI